MKTIVKAAIDPSCVNFKRTLFGMLLTLAWPLSADSPADAYIDLSSLENNAYPAAVCYMASVGQLINYQDDQSAVEELMAMTGFCTEYYWASTGGGSYVLDPHRYVYNVPLKLFAGQSLDLYRLSGLMYSVGYLKSGSGNATVCANARSITKFSTEAQAVSRLKEVIACGYPVQVHLDFQYISQEVGVYYPLWQNCNEASSHFVVVHGYDANYVYYTDNNPTTAIDVDDPADGQTDGVGVPISWSAFLSAWYYAGAINQNDKNIRCGPYYMFYLVEDPARASALQVLRHLYDRGVNGPAALRSAATAIALDEAQGSSILSQYLRDRKGEMTPLMADYLQDAGYDDLADQYDQIAALWATIRENPDWSEVPQVLNDIADLTEDSWEAVAALTADISPISLLATGGAPQDLDEDQVWFRWANPLSWQVKSFLELAMKGDFNDTPSVLRIPVPVRQCKYGMTNTMWYKAFAKNDGDRQLTWRIVNGAQISDTAVFEWLPMEITLTSPADGFELAAGQSLELAWDAPVLAQKLKIQFCQNNQFADRRLMTSLNLSRGAQSQTIPAKTVTRIKRYADVDGWIYCRIVDASAAKTTVQPSDIIRIKL